MIWLFLKRGVVFLCCFFLLLSCSKNSPCIQREKKTTLYTNITYEPLTLDPRKARRIGDINIIVQLQEGLLQTLPSGELAPALCESYAISPDGLTYTFTLREALWSHGEPITSKDFLYAIHQSLSPKFPSDNAFLLYPIKNAEKIKKGELPSLFLGISAPSDNILVIELERPLPYFPKLVTLPIYFPLPKDIDTNTPNWSSNPKNYPCSGPFILEQWNHENEIVLRKNPSYWDNNHVSLHEVQMIMVDIETGLKMYENNRLDFAGSPFCPIPAAKIPMLLEKKELFTVPLQQTYFIRCNTNIQPLDRPAFRKALARSFSRENITQYITQNAAIPAYGLAPKTQQTKFLPTIESLNFSSPLFLTFQNKESMLEIAQFIQDEWKKTLGLDIRLEPLEPKSFFQRIASGDFQLAICDWIADYSDPISFYEIFKDKTTPMNHTGWSHIEYANLVDEYHEKAEERREAITLQLEDILQNEMPIIPLYYGTATYVKKKHIDHLFIDDLDRIYLKYVTKKSL